MMTFSVWLIRKNLLRQYRSGYNVPKHLVPSLGGEHDADLAGYVNGFYAEVVLPAVNGLPLPVLKTAVIRRFDRVRHNKDSQLSPFLYEDLQGRLDRFVKESEADFRWQPGQEAHWLERVGSQGRFATLKVKEDYLGRNDPDYVGPTGIPGSSGDPLGGQVSWACQTLPPPGKLEIDSRCSSNFRAAPLGTAFLGIVKIGARTGSATDVIFLVAVHPMSRHITASPVNQDLGPVQHTGNPSGHLDALDTLVKQHVLTYEADESWNGIALDSLSKGRLNETGALLGFGIVKGNAPPDHHSWEYTSRSLNEYATGRYERNRFFPKPMWTKGSPHVPDNWAQAIYRATRRL